MNISFTRRQKRPVPPGILARVRIRFAHSIPPLRRSEMVPVWEQDASLTQTQTFRIANICHQHHVSVALHFTPASAASAPVLCGYLKKISKTTSVTIGHPQVFFKRLGMQAAVPDLAAFLIQLFIGFIVHQHQRHLVGHRPRTEEEKIIIARVHPPVAQAAAFPKAADRKIPRAPRQRARTPERIF